jgi:hypothetical protein
MSNPLAIDLDTGSDQGSERRHALATARAFSPWLFDAATVSE